LNKLALEEKEKYRWLEIEIERYIDWKTPEKIIIDLEKIIDKINKDTYKKLEKELKDKMSSNTDYIKDYMELLAKWKKHNIK
jgi:flagellar motor component MotA